MLNAGETRGGAGVVDYAQASVAEAMAAGRMNTDDATLLAHVRAAIRRGHPQMRTWPNRPERVCLVGSGPSLAATEDALRQAVWEGAKLVTLNGAYHWCIAHGLKPQTQIVMDARASNARFVEPAVPGCRYVLASQCHPATWDAVEGREDVWIWHGIVKGSDDPIAQELDRFYAGQWFGVGGGTTVATRALTLLRMAGYLRFELFGVDCCWLDNQHHALEQPENAADRRIAVRVGDRERPETMREFVCAPWHLKQLEDFIATFRLNGQHFTVNVHGDGMLAYVMATLGDGEPADVMPVSGTPATDQE